MSQFYGYRCYTADNVSLGWFYVTGRDYVWTEYPADLHWCKRWKTIRGAQKSFDHFNQSWNFRTKGGYLKIEVMPDFEIPPTRTTLKRQAWDAAKSDPIEQSDKEPPVINFRPTPDVRAWLDEERWDNDGVIETDSVLVNRKLEKLRKLEDRGH
jgi:hypothetical protein